MKLIYQIGRLDTRMENLEFVINNETYKKPLSSFALKEYSKRDSKVILIYPVSLPFNKNLYGNKSELNDDLKNKIKKICENKKEHNEYFKNPINFLKNLYSEFTPDDIIPIHSIGEYEGVKFGGDFNDIVLEIFVDLTERFINEEFDELYADISSGLNIYISAFLEAIKYFSIFSKLMNWLDKEKAPKVYIVYSDPIIGSSLSKYKIYLHKVEFKAFFSSPIKHQDLSKFNVKKYLENFILIFSSLKNNIPLGLYHFGFHECGEIKNILSEKLKTIKDEFSKNWKDSPSLNKDEHIKLILSLAFYMGIVEVLAAYKINKYDSNKGISLSKIKNKFCPDSSDSLYKYFGLNLNIEWLRHEFDEFQKRENKIRKLSQDWKLLGKGSLEKRNFLAHCGFDINITEAKKEDNEIYFRWVKEKDGEIKKYLFEET